MSNIKKLIRISTLKDSINYHTLICVLLICGFIFGLVIFRLNKSIFIALTNKIVHDRHEVIDFSLCGNALFVFLLAKRIGRLLYRTILSTTYFGLVYVLYSCFKFGLELGIFFGAFLGTLGIGGGGNVFLVILLPMLIQIIVFILFGIYAIGLYQDIYIKKQPEKINKYFLRLVKICFCIVLEVTLECILAPNLDIISNIVN